MEKKVNILFMIMEKFIILKLKKFLQGTSKTGYLVYNLRFNGKRYYKLAHRLVAEYFLDNCW